MSQIIDNLISLRILHILLTPIENSEAYRLGIVDKNGKQIKKPKSEEERDSWTNLTKIIFKLKSILAKNLQGEKDIRAIANSMHIAKECMEYDIETLNIENIFNESIDYVTEEDVEKVKSMLLSEDHISFKKFIEEDAPANNASATPGIDGFTPETLRVNKRQKLIKRKSKDRHQHEFI